MHSKITHLDIYKLADQSLHLYRTSNAYELLSIQKRKSAPKLTQERCVGILKPQKLAKILKTLQNLYLLFLGRLLLKPYKTYISHRILN